MKKSQRCCCLDVWPMLATAILPLLLLVATVSASTAPASASPSQIDVCSSSYLNACRKITVPTGFYLNKDGNGQIVGISINTTTTLPCTPTMKAAHQQLLIICGCIATLEDKLKKAPALSRPGMTRALDYFTGVTAAVLADVLAAESCLLQHGVKQIDINRQKLEAILQQERSLRVLAGTSLFEVSKLPAVSLTTYLDINNKGAMCLPAFGRRMQWKQDISARSATAAAAAAAQAGITSDAGLQAAAAAAAAVAAGISSSSGQTQHPGLPAAAHSSVLSSQADPSASSIGVSDVCTPFVASFISYAGAAQQQASAAVMEILQLCLLLLQLIVNNLQTINDLLDSLATPAATTDFLQEAGDAAAAVGCMEPYTCLSGLLGDSWHALQNHFHITESADVVNATQQLSRLCKLYHNSYRDIYCSMRTRVDNSAHQQEAVLEAFAACLAKQHIQSREQLFKYPGLLSDLMAILVNLPVLGELGALPSNLRDAVQLAEQSLDAIIDRLQTRFSHVVAALSENIGDLLARLPGGERSPICAGTGQQRQECNNSSCAAPTPDELLNNSTNATLCAAGWQCWVDGCANCTAACERQVPLSDVPTALKVLKSWMSLVRSRYRPDADTSTAQLRDSYSKLKDGLDFLRSQNLGPFSTNKTRPGLERGFMGKSGYLSFNRQGTLVGSFPCVQGTNRTCYSSPGSRFKACCTTPRISMCKVNSVVQLPNNQVPWTMVHGGLKLMMSRAITLMNSTWSFGNGNTPAGDVITCQTHSSKQRGK